MKSEIQLIVIGGSAGSLQVVLKILGFLHPGFPIPILLVLHRKVQFDSSLEELLTQRTLLRVKEIEDKESIRDGYVYICPANYHVLIEKDVTFSLDSSEKVNFSRPSIDVAFAAAAEVYQNKVLAVLLSGANADGSNGLKKVKEKKGVVVVQHPGDAQVPAMPQYALRNVKADHVLTASEIAGLLNSLSF